MKCEQKYNDDDDMVIKTQLEMCVFWVFFSYPHIKLACEDWKTNTDITKTFCSYL